MLTIEAVKRIDGENFDDYFVRLFENKKEYGLNCQDIADILNKESGSDYTESKWRKEYAAFNRGRQYERNKDEDKVSRRILTLSDFHIPFQLPIETFKDYVGFADTLVLNGDVLDLQSLSKFAKSYHVPFMEEMIKARRYIIDLIEYLGTKEVYFVVGNHEKRFAAYLQKEFDGTDMFELFPDDPLDLLINTGFTHYDKRDGTSCFYCPLREVLSDVKINYDGNYYVKINKSIFVHPIAYSSKMLGTAERALNYFYRTETDFDTIVMAHTHKFGLYTQGNVTVYEQGCLCDLSKMNYTAGKLILPQQNGFALICQNSDGELIYDKSKLIQV